MPYKTIRDPRRNSASSGDLLLTGYAMKIRDLIERLTGAVAHGQNAEAKMMLWDPDANDWAPLIVMELNATEVRMYTDEA